MESLDLLESFGQRNPESVCKLIYGACPMIPDEHQQVNLPAIVFNAELNEPPDIGKFMGLYYFKIKQNKSIIFPLRPGLWIPQCEIIENRQILNLDGILAKKKVWVQTG